MRPCGRPEPILRLYNELKENILIIGQDITLKPKEGMLNDPRKMARDISKLGHHGNGDYEIKSSDTKEIGYVISLIRQS